MPRKKRKRKTPSAEKIPQLPAEFPPQPTTAGKKRATYDPDEPALGQSPLTAREEEVVACAAKGGENLEIALQLQVDERTIEKHMKNIREKLHARTRTAVTSWWYERKIEQLELRLREGK